MSWVQNDGNQFGLPLQPAQSKQSQPSSVREDFPGLDDIAAVLRAASLPLYVTPRVNEMLTTATISRLPHPRPGDLTLDTSKASTRRSNCLETHTPQLTASQRLNVKRTSALPGHVRATQQHLAKVCVREPLPSPSTLSTSTFVAQPVFILDLHSRDARCEPQVPARVEQPAARGILLTSQFNRTSRINSIHLLKSVQHLLRLTRFSGAFSSFSAWHSH